MASERQVSRMEWRDLYDKDRVKTGQQVKRGDPVPEHTYWMAVHVCIINSQNEMLIQHRQPFKRGWPNYWDLSVGGGAIAGETSQLAAERETMEELGIRVNLSGIRPAFTANFSQGFDDVYVLEMDLDLNQLVLSESEVQEVRWASKEEIFRMIEEGSFIPFQKCAIEMIFTVRSSERGLLAREENE